MLCANDRHITWRSYNCADAGGAGSGASGTVRPTKVGCCSLFMGCYASSSARSVGICARRGFSTVLSFYTVFQPITNSLYIN
jgi:hypothetical protein